MSNDSLEASRIALLWNAEADRADALERKLAAATAALATKDRVILGLIGLVAIHGLSGPKREGEVTP